MPVSGPALCFPIVNIHALLFVLLKPSMTWSNL